MPTDNNADDVLIRNATDADMAAVQEIYALQVLEGLASFEETPPDEVELTRRRDALVACMPDDSRGLDAGGAAKTAYADAVAVYLGISSDRLADRNSALCSWDLAQAARGRVQQGGMPRLRIGRATISDSDASGLVPMLEC